MLAAHTCFTIYVDGMWMLLRILQVGNLRGRLFCPTGIALCGSRFYLHHGVLMNPEDMQRVKVVMDQVVTLECACDSQIRRAVSGLRVQPFDLPESCVASYYPETNALVPLDKYDLKSKTPAYKGTAVRGVA